MYNHTHLLDMGKSASLVLVKKMCVPIHNNILLQTIKILPTISPIYWVNLSISTVLSQRKIMEE
jgi:hypothetical protein